MNGQVTDGRSYDLKADDGKSVSFPKNDRFRMKINDNPASNTYNIQGPMDMIPSYIKSSLGKK